MLAVGVDGHRRSQSKPNSADVIQSERGCWPPAGHRAGLEVEVECSLDGSDDSFGDRRAVLDEYPGAGRELTFGQPAHSRGQISDRCWRSVGRGENVASGHVDIGAQPDHD